MAKEMCLFALIQVSAAPTFASGKELFAAVDKKIGHPKAVRVEEKDYVNKKPRIATISIMAGGYARSETVNEIDITSPKGGWLLHKDNRTFEELKPGELDINPFIWRTWGAPDKLIYGPVEQIGTSYRTSLKSKGQDTRLEVDIDSVTLLPTEGRIFAGHNPETLKVHWFLRKFDFHPVFSPSDFEFKPPVASS